MLADGTIGDGSGDGANGRKTLQRAAPAWIAAPTAGGRGAILGAWHATAS